jgi:hypothetical protein
MPDKNGKHGPIITMGDWVITQAARDVFTAKEIIQCLQRHAKGDWGDITETARDANTNAVKTGGRVISSYTFHDGRILRIHTEAGRKFTIVFLPQEH